MKNMDIELAKGLLIQAGFDPEDDFGKEYVQKFAKSATKRLGKPIPPKESESLAVTLLTPKTAALAYDKVYRIPIIESASRVPEEIGFYGATRSEQQWLASILNAYFIKEIGLKLHSNPILEQYRENSPYANSLEGSIRLMLSDFVKETDFEPTFFYHSDPNYRRDFPLGPQQILHSVITDVAMVDESKLDWKQVMDFRKDEEAKIKYKRFIRWLNGEMISKTHNQLSDEIALKLDDYSWSIKKHGMQTILGSISGLLDAKFVAPTSAATVAAALSGGGEWAALTSMTIILGKTAVNFGTSYIDGLEQKRKTNYEIAYIYDIKQKLQ